MMVTGINYVLLAVCITLLTVELVRSDVCNYLQCTKSVNKITKRSYVVVKYNESLWQETHSNGATFDFRAWNWKELDDIAHGEDASVEVVFNGLDVVQVDTLDGHDKVFSLSLDGNGIKQIEKKAFQLFRRLRTLTMRANMITNIDHGFFSYDNPLEHLDLSTNFITTLGGFKDLTWTSLRRLNLSRNHIEHVANHLVKLDTLEWVDLSDNRIKRHDGFILPRNLRRCILNNNQLTAWPFDSVPRKLMALSIRSNQLTSIESASANGVQTLDLSHNKLSSFCSKCFPNLEELDLSGNYFESLPDWTASVNTSALRKISFSRMPYLRSIKNTSFEKMANLKEITIATCPKLTDIERNTFTGMEALESLDLSYNGLQKVHEDIVDWEQIRNGVNLQGNPFDCDCSMQWFLDKVIGGMLRRRELHALLADLRCKQPTTFKDVLMVRLTVHDSLLCRQTNHQISASVMEQISHNDEDISLKLFILCCLIFANVVTLWYLVYLKTRRRYETIPIRF